MWIHRRDYKMPQVRERLNVGNYQISFDTDIAQLDEKLNLSGREGELLSLLAQGKPLKVCAYEMGISTHTADTHKRRLFQKLGVNCVVSATTIALSLMMGGEVQLAA